MDNLWWDKCKSTNSGESSTTYASSDFYTNTWLWPSWTNSKLVEDELLDFPQMFERLKSYVKTPIYGGCNKLTRLSMVLKLYNLKAGTNGLIRAS